MRAAGAPVAQGGDAPAAFAASRGGLVDAGAEQKEGKEVQDVSG